jgi:hypothetical protein
MRFPERKAPKRTVERVDLNALQPLHPMVGADVLIGRVSGGDFRTDEGIGP